MLITDSLTIGQITFILRVIIQIISYAGAFIIGLIVLGVSPRIASIHTHDVLSRAVGKSTSTKFTLKWIFKYIAKRNTDPSPPIRLLIALLLLLSFSLFVSLTDLGFLGFYSCQQPWPSTFDYPASVRNDSLALSTVASNMVNGTDPSTVNAYRCDSSEVISFGVNVTEWNCTSWHNSTYADASLFKGLNTTDSDVLMARQLRQIDDDPTSISLNSFYLGAASSKINTPTITRGIAIQPSETGLVAVFGVPYLNSQQRVDLEKTFALEVEVGCMTVGILTVRVDTQIDPEDVFQDTDWQPKYTGPDYMRNTLQKYINIIRENQRPLFNQSTLFDGAMTGYNSTELTGTVGDAARIQNWFLGGSDNDNITLDLNITQNCTHDLQTKLGITIDKDWPADDLGAMCGFLGLSGSTTENGVPIQGFSRMFCASASQLNMVSATIITGADNTTTVNITRLPSDLFYMRADYWDVSNSTFEPNATQYTSYVPIERYTLSDNPSSPTSHYIPQFNDYGSSRTEGPGSGGTALGRAGSLPWDFFDNGNTNGLDFLSAGSDAIAFDPNLVTQWAASISASYLLQSTAYNGFAARSAPPILVTSTGGRSAVCYTPSYAFSLLPLIVAVIVAIAWGAHMLFTSSFGSLKTLQALYGGMAPVRGVIEAWDTKDVLLAWETASENHHHLAPIYPGEPIPMVGHEATAVSYLKSSLQKS